MMSTETMQPIRFSHLKQMALSPYHYQYARANEAEQSLAMRIGSVTHALICGAPVAVYPGPVRRGKEWEAFAAANCDRVICNTKEFEESNGVADAVRAHVVASTLILGADRREETQHWTTLEMPCRGTPDAWTDQYVVDLKTTRCAEPEKFQRDAMFRAYHAQLAWYADGLAEMDGKVRDCFIVAVENKAPYAVSVHKLTAGTIEQGRRLNRLWLERVKVCEASGEWPGYSPLPLAWDIPEVVELDFGTGDDDAP